MLSPAMVQGSFIACCALTGIAMWVARESASSKPRPEAGEGFQGFQRLYLRVYLLATFSDWLQGPYVYALYESYGFPPRDIAVLFVAGFGSSMVFGTVVGVMADSTGRKRSALIYCALYIASCLTKHVNRYWVLMVGRITGGMATSLLFSVFDSWLVCEHNARGFHADLLGETLSLATFGNSVVAIAAGVLSQFAADFQPLKPPVGPGVTVHRGGYCGPFDLAVACLVLCGGVAWTLWSENYGEKQESSVSLVQVGVVREAAQIIYGVPEVLYCGVVCALFEASMFIFVFQWTPAVSPAGQPKPPYGHIFATFMVACMLGSRIFSLASKFLRVEVIGQILLAVAMCTHAVPVFSSDPAVCFYAFLAFELCVGVYFPTLGTLKGDIVPESMRATIYNLYRVPLNLLVVTSLVAGVSTCTAFKVTCVLLCLALVAMTFLAGARPEGKPAREAVPTGPKWELDPLEGQTIGAADAEKGEQEELGGPE